MKQQGSGGVQVLNLLSIVLIYVLLIALVLVFSGRLLGDASTGKALNLRIILPMAVLLPLFLLVVTILNILRLMRERRERKPGIQFKIRLVVFFSFISLVSSIPQGVLSISFINTALNSWLSDDLGDAIRGGLTVALAYNDGAIRNLEAVAESGVFSSVFRDVGTSPERVYDVIRGANSQIHSLQVFDIETGYERFFAGDERLRLKEVPRDYAPDGVLPRTTSGTVSAIRVIKQIPTPEGNFAAVLGSLLPEGFDGYAERLSSALETFYQFKKLKNMFYITLLAFYGFFFLPILLLSFLIAFLLAGEVLRPIVNLEEATRRVAEGDFSYRILTRPGDELSVLVDSFNKMVLELERSRNQIMQTEKVAAWQEIARRMAHEIKNPLTPIKLSAERLIRKYKTDPDAIGPVLEASVSAITREVENLNNLLLEFNDFAGLPPPQKAPCDIAEIIGGALSTYLSGHPGIVARTEGLQSFTISADKNQMHQVFSNLLKNACEAMGQEGEIILRTDLVRKQNNQYCRIHIEDTGAGIAPEHRDQVFNPYFTTKENGSGLGLSIVERIIFDHKGQIWFETEKGVGTTFFIDLPAENADGKDSHNR